MTQEDNSAERGAMEDRFAEGKGYVVFFDNIWWRNNAYPEKDLVANYNLQPVFEGEEGTIYLPGTP